MSYYDDSVEEPRVGKRNTGVSCQACHKGNVAEEITKEELTLVTRYHCDRCGVVYKFLPEVVAQQTSASDWAFRH